MTHLFNRPGDFGGEFVTGFAAANARWVRPVTGGVVRAQPAGPGRVAVARPLAARSLGSPDPGVVSLGLICQAVAGALTNANDS